MPGVELLSTGAAARLLGTSRQHVVDLCDREQLPYVRVGTHRRVSRDAVEQLVDRGTASLTKDQERSLWLHRAVAAELVLDPEGVLATARENLQRWGAVHRADGMTAHWLARWDQVLGEGVDVVADVLGSRAPTAVELRQNSPFAGVVPGPTRRRVLRSFAQHWRRDHLRSPAA